MTWNITQNEQNKKWYFSVADNDPGSIPEYADFYVQALSSGIEKTDIINARQFEAYIKKIKNRKAPPLEIQLPETFDAKIITSQDKAHAELYVRKAKNSDEGINEQLITAMLNNSGIKTIDMQEINKKLNEFLHAETRETIIFLAEAIPPKRGKNRTLIEHITKFSDADTKKILKKFVAAIKAGREHPQVIYDKDFSVSEAQIVSIVNKNDVLFSFSEPELGEDGRDIYGNIIEGLPGNDPFVLDLRNIIQKRNELTALCSGIVLAAQTDKGLKIRIIPYKDATVKAVISTDKMTASLILESGKGAGDHLDIRRLKKALDELQLPPENYSTRILENAIRSARRTSSQIEYIICSGIPPVAPQSYAFKWNVTFTHENKVAVKKNDIILETIFLKDGKSGIDVFGNTIPIDSAYVTMLPEHNDSIRLHKNGNTISFIANASGELSHQDNLLKITSSKIIKSTIKEEGEDIRFGGDLTIQGSIGGYRSVKTDGALTITGDTGIALVYSKDSLTMVGGIKGEHRGTLWAKNTITTAYAETARLLAGGDIQIEEYSFRCIVKTNGRLSLTGTPGSFVGGIAHTAQGLYAKNLGDYRKIRTIVSFGQDYLIKDKIELYQKEIQQNTIEITRIDAELAKNELNQNHKQELRSQKARLLKRSHIFSLKIFALKENFETHIPSKIEITGNVYPGVILESHGRYYEVHQPLSSVCFSFDTEKGIISYCPLETNSHN